MRYWWVNQNQTYKHEVQGGFLWSPKRNKDGRRNQFYENMRLVEAGDLVFSFADTFIKAVGIAKGGAQSSDQPDLGAAGSQWHDDGWLVPVEFQEVDRPIRPKDYMDELGSLLTAKYAPLQANGNGNQGVYLAEVTTAFADVLLSKLGKTPADYSLEPDADADPEADNAQSALEGRTDIGATQKEQLVKARRGQGIFKANVRLNERSCRMTGVNDPRLLIASHIKPWAVSDDREKLDGCNGLLLSPHIDRLFDSGLITFEDTGRVLVSSSLDRGVFTKWAINPDQNVGRFSAQQATYLEYHRANRFKP